MNKGECPKVAITKKGRDFVMKDRLTPELREIKKEVDNYYKSNPLVKLPFATAVWYLLAFTENKVLRSPQDDARIVDGFVNVLKHPMYWLYGACTPGGQVPFAYNSDFYEASRDLFDLGRKYRAFVSAFKCGSWGLIGLELQESKIQPTENLFTDIEYEAYNRLIKPHKSQEASFSVNSDDLHLLREAIRHSVRIDRDRFKYQLNPKIVSDTITAIKPTLDAIFLFPSDWQLSRYTLGEFRKVFESILAIAYIHVTAWEKAIAQGCEGYADSIYVPTCDELLRRVVRYSRVSESEVRSIFDDLSYGSRDILNPDPALQPLIKLNSEVYAVMPHLWLCCSPERNLTVLLNRLSCDEKKIYAKLVSKKEDLMRKRFTTGLSAKDFRLIWGWVLGLPPDIDLAIINDSEKMCLLLELKWFIYPAEIHEVIGKSKMIKKGISQLIQLKDAFANNHKPLLEKLKIESNYRLEGVVVSENWIGHAKVQSPEIPVIQADHLIAKLRVTESLESVMEWLKDRKYLPTEGEHFEVPTDDATIGNWSVRWYEIRSLIRDPFFPL